MNKINLQEINKVYFIGIKGVGMSALAQVFSGLGVDVKGSDTKEKFFTDTILEQAEIEVIEGFDADNISRDVDCCVISNAYMDKQYSSNPEVRKVQSLDIPVFTYGEALSSLFNRAGLRLAVAGTHGKSTTTAMLGRVLTEQFKNPPFCVVGTELLDWQSNAWVPQIKKEQNLLEHSFLIEADEYKEACLNYNPHLLVLTNIDFDHPDYFSNQEEYLEVYVRLIEGMEPSPLLDYSAPVLIARRGDKNIEKVIERIDSPLKVFYFDFPEKELDLPVPARVYQLNAAAALKTTQILDIKDSRARKTLSQFSGTRRRLEKEKISVQNKEVVFIDDYAHHPKEIAATLDYIFNRYPKEEVQVVFQPHTFSRSKAFLDNFAKVLGRTDNLVIVPTYGSAREKKGEIQAEDIYENINKKNTVSRLHCTDSLKEADDYLQKRLKAGEVVLTLGAGDIWKLKEKLSEA